MEQIIETLFSMSLVILAIGFIWGFIGTHWTQNPYFYSLPLQKKMLTCYFPFILSAGGLIGLIISFLLMIIASIF